MGRIKNQLTELIGSTPLLRLNNYNEAFKIEADIIAKIESFNPAGSVKDRAALAMISDAEESGLINKDTVIIESTSGNTGIALALVAAVKKYRLIITLPDTFSIERRKMLKALGAEVILTNGEEGMRGAISKAEELSKEIPNSFIPRQFENKSNVKIHEETTAEEIWVDTDGKIDIFVSGVGTGGTIIGVAKGLKKKNPNIKIIAVEPYNSAVLSGERPGSHNLQGLGAGFIPPIFEDSYVDEYIKVRDSEAYEVTGNLAKTEGLLVGISSGAALAAAAQLAKRKENKGKTIVVLLPDTGERYLSTQLFND